eukprot:1624-Chlamydomonas_euryale.AAC.1
MRADRIVEQRPCCARRCTATAAAKQPAALLWARRCLGRRLRLRCERDGWRGSTGVLGNGACGAEETVGGAAREFWEVVPAVQKGRLDGLHGSLEKWCPRRQVATGGGRLQQCLSDSWTNGRGAVA